MTSVPPRPSDVDTEILGNSPKGNLAAVQNSPVLQSSGDDVAALDPAFDHLRSRLPAPVEADVLFAYSGVGSSLQGVDQGISSEAFEHYIEAQAPFGNGATDLKETRADASFTGFDW